MDAVDERLQSAGVRVGRSTIFVSRVEFETRALHL